MDSSCEYIEQTVPDRRQGAVLQLVGWASWLTTLHLKNPTCYEMLHRASELAGSCEHGNEPSGCTEEDSAPCN